MVRLFVLFYSMRGNMATLTNAFLRGLLIHIEVNFSLGAYVM